MKKKDVPQDDAGLMEGHQLDLYYVVDESGNYTTERSSGWNPKNTAMQQAWEVVEEKIEEVSLKVQNGELSPIAYFMEKSLMDVKTLAQYVDLPKRKVRRHLKPKYFDALDENILEKYAGTFEISVDYLRNYKGTAE